MTAFGQAITVSSKVVSPALMLSGRLQNGSAQHAAIVAPIWVIQRRELRVGNPGSLHPSTYHY